MWKLSFWSSFMDLSCCVRNIIVYVLSWRIWVIDFENSHSDKINHMTRVSTSDTSIKSCISKFYLGKTLQCILFGNGYFCCPYSQAPYQRSIHFSNNNELIASVPLPYLKWVIQFGPYYDVEWICRLALIRFSSETVAICIWWIVLRTIWFH